MYRIHFRFPHLLVLISGLIISDNQGINDL
jgi:hypothetical protein